MKKLTSLLLLACCCLLTGQDCLAQNKTNFPRIGEVLEFDPALKEIISEGTEIEVVASGFDWTEGPVWVPGNPGHLLFADIPRNSVMSWSEQDGLSVFLKPSGFTGPEKYGSEPGCNGLALNSKKQLVSCEHGDRRISVLTKGGGKRTLTDNYQGKRLNSPNDLVFHSNGDLYFTDPPYGLPGGWDDPGRELDFCGVYRLTPKGELTPVIKDLTRPNGVALSPDEKTLYVAQSDPKAALMLAYPLRQDGSVGEAKVLYDATKDVGKLPGLPDGLAVAKDGSLFVTGPGGVYVFSPQGKLLGRISTGEKTSNCAFGGPNGDVLYMTADMYLCRIQTKRVGLTHNP